MEIKCCLLVYFIADLILYLWIEVAIQFIQDIFFPGEAVIIVDHRPITAAEEAIA